MQSNESYWKSTFGRFTSSWMWLVVSIFSPEHGIRGNATPVNLYKVALIRSRNYQSYPYGDHKSLTKDDFMI